MTGRRPDTLRTVTHTSPTYWRERAGNFSTVPQMFKERGWHAVSFGKTFDLRTSGNKSDAWICDGAYSWSEPAVFCGTTTWARDTKLAARQSHALLDEADEARVGDRMILDAALAKLNGSSASGPLPTDRPWLVAVS